MRCPSCGNRGAPTARYCDRCGTALPTKPDAAARADPPAGSPTAATGRRPDEPEGADLAGDRRIVTALFADLVDYVRMLAEHDPEEVRARVTRALATMADAIERMGGTREKFIGDAVFAVFGWPRAHGDDAVRASLAALAIRAGLREIGDGIEPMEVRIGIATGEVVAVGDRPGSAGDLGLTGEAITTAARIQSLAGAGEILLDEATRRAARDRLATDPRGAVVLRGQTHAVGLHGLLGEAGSGAWMPYRPPTPGPLVGRARERSALADAIRALRDHGRGGAIALVGEAGMGKSRLLASVEGAVRAAGLAWTWTESLSYRRTEPYRWARLFAQMVADEHGTDSGAFARRLLFTEDLHPAVIRRYGGAIAAIARDAAFSGWEAEAADTPADPAVVTSTLAEVAARYLDRLLETAGPRAVVVDDVHLVDPSSVRMVELLLERSVDRPLLVLLGVRPDAIPPWLDRAGLRRVVLGGLAERETQRLATLVARASVDAADARRIHLRTAGNPLFVGETVRAYLEDGTLQRRGGRAAMSGAGRPRLPVTMRAVIGARIDALDAEAREVLDVAAVVGIVFQEATVAEVLDGRPARAALDRIAATALVVHEHRGRWRFAHGLIHEAAYAGLLARRRRAIHARLADQLEARADAAAPGLVAAHRVAAGQAALAVPLLRHAASAALAVGAVEEATGWWRQAAELAGEAAPPGSAGPTGDAAPSGEAGSAPAGNGSGRGSGGRP